MIGIISTKFLQIVMNSPCQRVCGLEWLGAGHFKCVAFWPSCTTDNKTRDAADYARWAELETTGPTTCSLPRCLESLTATVIKWVDRSSSCPHGVSFCFQEEKRVVICFFSQLSVSNRRLKNRAIQCVFRDRTKGTPACVESFLVLWSFTASPPK